MFNELKIYSQSNFGIFPLDSDDFEALIHMPDAAKVLALLGDAVIDLALVQIHWNPSISKVGELSKKRSKFASNMKLASICDRWDLYEYRIHQDPYAPDTKRETVDHVKGTIIEAIFGVVYIESGLEQVISSVSVLK